MMIARSPEVRHLTALIALARELHFGRAAQRLGMTQPALSQLIRELESRLGFRVVERTTRKVLMTKPGQFFLVEAEDIVRRLDKAAESARGEAGQEANSIRIGAILPTSFEFLPSVLIAFRKRYPSASIHIESKESPHLVTALETGALHVALLRPPRSSGTLRIETLRREPFVVAMRTDHKFATAEALHFHDLSGEKIVRIAREDLRNAFAEIDLEIEKAGISLDESQVADTTLTAMALVCAGDGISFVPSWTAALPWRNICFRRVSDLTARIDLAVAWDASNLPPIALHFIEVARRVAGSTTSSGSDPTA